MPYNFLLNECTKQATGQYRFNFTAVQTLNGSRRIIMMKNKFLLTVFSSLILTISWAQPKKVLADKIVGVVGNKVVLKKRY